MKKERQHCPCFKHFLTFISLVSLGKNNFSRLDPEVLNKKVVLVMDNDGALISSDKIFIRNYPETPRKNVQYVLPPVVDCLDKSDMNYVLVHY